MGAAEIIIEKNIPIPNLEEFYKVQLENIEIGESFGFPFSNRPLVISLIRIGFHNYTNKRFKVSIKGQPSGMARVWREADHESK